MEFVNGQSQELRSYSLVRKQLKKCEAITVVDTAYSSLRINLIRNLRLYRHVFYPKKRKV